MKIGDKVTYHGETRPRLKNYEGKITSGPTASGSWLVEFFHENPFLAHSEWVGERALKLVESDAVSDVRAKIMVRIKELEKQISTLRSEVSRLNAANKALKDLS